MRNGYGRAVFVQGDEATQLREDYERTAACEHIKIGALSYLWDCLDYSSGASDD